MRVRMVKRFEGFMPGEIAEVSAELGLLLIVRDLAVRADPESTAFAGAPETAVLRRPEMQAGPKRRS